MTLAKTLNSYNDIRKVLDTALANGEGFLTLADHGKAIHWRRRAYNYRALLIAKSTQHVPSTPYDDLVFDLNDKSIHIRVREIDGILRSKDGTILEIVDNVPDSTQIYKSVDDFSDKELNEKVAEARRKTELEDAGALNTEEPAI